MLEHIVKNGERIDQIMNLYRVNLDTIKSYNLHITDFNNLLCGMKIKIPLISEEIEQILENTESFVKDYYPKVIDVIEEVKVEEVKMEKPSFERGIPYPGIIPPKFIKKI